MTVAAPWAASWTAIEPTPPVAPTTSRTAPGPTSTASTTPMAVAPARGIAAAVSNDRPAGLRTTASSGPTAISSAYVPKWTVGHTGMKPRTSSPTARSVCPSPTASTTPPKSRPTIEGNSWGSACVRKPLAWKCPLVRQSGNRDVRGPLAKNGPKYLRWALIEAATHAARDAHYRERYERTKQRLGRQRGAKVARIDIARKLAEAIWHVLTNNEPFAPAGPTMLLVA